MQGQNKPIYEAENRSRSAQQSLLSKQKQGQLLLFFLLALALYGLFMILRPYIHTLILAVIFSSVSYPIYTFFLKKTHNRKNLSALCSTVAVGLLILIPLTVLLSSITYKGYIVLQDLRQWVEAGKLQDYWDTDEHIQQFIKTEFAQRFIEFQETYFPNLTLKTVQDNLLDYAIPFIHYLKGSVQETAIPFVQNILKLCFHFFLMLFVMFYCFRDGQKMLAYLLYFIPLSTQHQRLLFQQIKTLARSVVVGTFLTTLVQAVIAMLGFSIVGISWFFWGIMLGFASLVPVLGTTLVWFPCVIYLFITGSLWKAIFLSIWCIVAVGLADNFLRPLLMKGNTGLSSFILFFAILGGMSVFGIIGLIYGPFIVGISAALLYIYQLPSED